MNELLEGTDIEKAIHLVRVCKVTAYKACKLYGVKSDTLSAHLSGKVKSEVKGHPPRFTVEEEKTLLVFSAVKFASNSQFIFKSNKRCYSKHSSS